MDDSRRNFSITFAPGILQSEAIKNSTDKLYHAILAQCCKKCLGDKWVNTKGDPPKNGDNIVICPSCKGTGLRPVGAPGHRKDREEEEIEFSPEPGEEEK